MKVPGQCLLQVNKPTSDDNDENDGDNAVVVDETCCSETEGMLGKKKCSTRSGRSATRFASIALMNRLTLNSIEKCLDLNNIVHCLTGRGILQNAERQMSHFHHL